MNLSASNLSARRGSVLIIVLWVSLGLVATALYFANSMVLELKAADNNVAALEADQAIEGAALYVSNILATRANMMMIPTPSLFHADGVKVGNATFWLIGRDTNDLQTSPQGDHPIWGLVDECSRVNINTATAAMLLNLPQMTQNTSAAMFDWANTNTQPSTDGAKSETYSALNPAYLCKGSNYESPEELRMVYGLNMDFLYGEYENLTVIMDPNENDGMTLPPYDNQNGILDPGLLEYVTVWSHEATIGTNGSARISVSDTNSLSSLMSSNFPSLPPITGTYTNVLQLYANSGLSESQFQQIEPFLMNPTNIRIDQYQYGDCDGVVMYSGDWDDSCAPNSFLPPIESAPDAINHLDQERCHGPDRPCLDRFLHHALLVAIHRGRRRRGSQQPRLSAREICVRLQQRNAADCVPPGPDKSRLGVGQKTAPKTFSE